VNHARTHRIRDAGFAAITIVVVTAITLLALSLRAGLAAPGPNHSPLADSPAQGNTGAGGITAAAATAIARSHVQPDAVLVSAVAGKYSDVYTIRHLGDTLDQPDRMVWAVTFGADIEICPPPQPQPQPNAAPCSTRPGQIQVFLDYLTGEFLESATFSPA
jgi:hypothetical protein